MRRLAIVTVATVGCAGIVWADMDAIAQRRALMHNDGVAAKKLFDMAKGAVPFDLAVAQNSLKTLAEAADKTPKLFPDDSKTGGGTAALPAIWENKTDFNARFAKFGRDVAAAITATVDEASFKRVAPAVFENCGSCHELYKAKNG
jgi:cytochrome c556